jgi:hypothetical protein
MCYCHSDLVLSCHWVLTATLVKPHVTPLLSWNRMKIRWVSGTNATSPAPATKIPKLGVSLERIVVVTLF